MQNEIKNILKNIEKENNIKILFAVENGSRVWKMESKDSDYDVRFVFLQTIDKYIQINKPVGVMNGFFDKKGKKSAAKEALIDISGFDIFKYIKLLSNSNPTTIEWLMSDIVYHGEQNKNLKKYILDNFSQNALFYHYKSLCENNYTEFIKEKKKMTHKKYLYVFRGLLNALWVYNNNSVPPINFLEAVGKSKLVLGNDIYEKLTEIIELKSKGLEKDKISNIDILDDYVEKFLNKSYEDLRKHKVNMDFFNTELRNIVLNNQ